MIEKCHGRLFLVGRTYLAEPITTFINSLVEEEDDEDCGIYILSQNIDNPDEVELFLAVPIEIMAYVCWLGCKAQNDYFPEDLELVIGDKIPDFVSFLEENMTSKEDFQKVIDFANEKVCY